MLSEREIKELGLREYSAEVTLTNDGTPFLISFMSGSEEQAVEFCDLSIYLNPEVKDMRFLGECLQ